MSDLDALLSPIRNRVEAYRDHGTPGLHAPQDRAQLLAAVEGVLRGHAPRNVPWSMDQYCSVCRGDVAQLIKYPCATVRALTEPLTP